MKAFLDALNTTVEEIYLSVNYRNCVTKLVIADAANAREEYRGQNCDHKGLLIKKKYKRK